MSLLLSSIETACQQALALDPETATQLTCLEGQVFALEIPSLNSTTYIKIEVDNISILQQLPEQITATICGEPFTLLNLAITQDSRLFSQGEIELLGDTAKAQQFLEIIGGLQIDWEALLAAHIGNMPAALLSRLRKQAKKYKSTQRLKIKLGDYLQEEANILVSPAENAEHLHAVDTLSTDMDRLEARIQQLEQ